MSNNANAAARPADAPQPPRKVVVAPSHTRGGDSLNIIWAILAAFVSVLAHALIVFLVWQIDLGGSEVKGEEERQKKEGKVKTVTTVDDKKDEEEKKEPDLTDLEIASEPMPTPAANPVDLIADVNVAGPVLANEAVGVLMAPEGAARNVPPPPGSGNGTGGAPLLAEAGTGAMWGTSGGMNGVMNIGAFGGRSGASREKLLKDGGGTELSEACVGRGLNWLALHQRQDGGWSLEGFNKNARTAPYPAGKLISDNSTGQAGRGDDVAATGLALLPFLAAGQTHKAAKVPPKIDYHKGINAGVYFLISKQGKDGNFGGTIYSHSIATIALCEAYGLTSDPLIKGPAQRALDHLVGWQDPAGGGWRYEKRQAGDLSVTGWTLMALKSGQMSGLTVPAGTIKLAERFLDASETPETAMANAWFNKELPEGPDNPKTVTVIGYGYVPRSGATPAMTGAGMLCRQYLGINPRNPKLLKGVEYIKQGPPEPLEGQEWNLYYLYYATQVMHHMGGDGWKFWNEGPRGNNGIRDTLIKRMDTGANPRSNANEGSWAPEGGGHVQSGGRIMSTALAMLCLEVYYRHLPLYRSDLGVNKGAN